jgi:DegV family protein with EDD domain
VVAITILLDDVEVRDRPEAAARVAAALRADRSVKTAPPDALAYARAVEEGDADEAIVLTPATEFTVMHRNALLAARLSTRRVEVVDTRTAAAAQGLVVASVLHALRRGATLDDALDVAYRAAARAELVASLPDLRVIERSGRVPAPLLGSARPEVPNGRVLFRFRDGAVVPLAATESAAEALQRLATAWRVGGGESAASAAVFHARNPREAAALRRLLGRPAPVVAFSPAMAVHTGLGCVGVAWLGAPKPRA